MYVGVRDLKQHLSEYLIRVVNGETIVVTDRGVPKVVISAAPGVDQLDLGVSEGWITAPKNINGLGSHVMQKSKRRSSDVLNEDRGE